MGEVGAKGVGTQGCLAGIATAITESSILVYANDGVPDSLNYPHDAVGSDHDSIGIFQQRASIYTDVAADMDPAQSAGSLPVVGYVGDLNSRAYCSDICTQRGFTIAGVSWQYCYCGNALGPQTANVVTTSCEGPCPADSNAICGGPNRLSVFASVDV